MPLSIRILNLKIKHRLCGSFYYFFCWQGFSSLKIWELISLSMLCHDLNRITISSENLSYNQIGLLDLSLILFYYLGMILYQESLVGFSCVRIRMQITGSPRIRRDTGTRQPPPSLRAACGCLPPIQRTAPSSCASFPFLALYFSNTQFYHYTLRHNILRTLGRSSLSKLHL